MEFSCDLLVAGGGVGGFAAALAACENGLNVVLTEETDWLGGQLTAQAVPPDEHPWIEQMGCTARYRQLRNRVREVYRSKPNLRHDLKSSVVFNPGSGWVSALCHEPAISEGILREWLRPYQQSGLLTLLCRHKPFDAITEADTIQSVAFTNLETGGKVWVKALWTIDATELGDLLAISGTEYVSGAESKSETNEPNAVECADPNNVQGLTWVFALGYDETVDSTIERPRDYDFWKTYQPDFWPGPLLGFQMLHPQTGEARTMELFSDDWYSLFKYRQIVNQKNYTNPENITPVTIANWPQNDYFIDSVIDVDSPVQWDHAMPGATGPVSAKRLEDARQLSLSLVYWLQTEAPRHDKGYGYPGCRVMPDITGTEDGLAKYPYIRESRRIRSKFQIREQHVATYTNPGRDRAVDFVDSVGIGAYRIDLHPSTSGANTIDTSTLPFQIPFGALVPERVKNLLAGCKNIGTTHITNGCYRLHPVEWNIGEAAGLAVSYCKRNRKTIHQVVEDPTLLRDFQRFLEVQGIELQWPILKPL